MRNLLHNFRSLLALMTLAAGLMSPRPAIADVYVVTTTADSGAGSLRDAITQANFQAGADSISFSIPGSGIQTIQPLTPLPTITDALTIDGTTQSPASLTPSVELRGDLVSGNPGLSISASNTVIRGLIINRFPNHGIEIVGGSQNTIIFNWIGTDQSGLAAGRNAGYGILLSNSAASNRIGGSSAAERNVISANGLYGIGIAASAGSSNQISGNYIGTDFPGTADLGNDYGGIELLSSRNIIGGTSAGQGNVITGRGSLFTPVSRIFIQNSDENEIYGNFIGTDAAGNRSLCLLDDGLGHYGDGISIYDGKNNTIGKPGAGNVISGNGAAIRLQTEFFGDNPGTTGNKIQSNLIGTNATGTAGVPNDNAILLYGILNPTADNLIGGVNTPGVFYGNVISGNGNSVGVGRAITMIGPEVQRNKIQGNYIGTAIDGSTPLGNSGPGILLDGSNNLIGGAGAGNILANSGETGITVMAGSGNRFSQNRIFGNAGLGIDEGPLSGANPVDPGDTDQGPNNYQNFPEFGVTIPRTGKIQVKGGLESTPSRLFTLEFYMNDAIDDSGYGEGQVYLGSQFVLTNEQGTGTFTAVLDGKLPEAGCITATATDETTGDTSEFSLSVQPTRDLKKGLKIVREPVVAIVEDVTTVSLPLYKPPPEKKTKTSSGVGTTAARKPKTVVEYQVTVTSPAGRTTQKVVSKKNIFTFKGLPAGTYQTSYVATLKQGKKVVARSKPSPAKGFVVSDS